MTDSIHKSSFNNVTSECSCITLFNWQERRPLSRICITNISNQTREWHEWHYINYTWDSRFIISASKFNYLKSCFFPEDPDTSERQSVTNPWRGWWLNFHLIRYPLLPIPGIPYGYRLESANPSCSLYHFYFMYH